MNSQFKAMAALFGVGAIWGITPLWIRSAECDALFTVACRALISAALLFFYRPSIFRSSKNMRMSEWLRITTCGVLAFVGTSTFAAAFSFIPPTNVYLIYFMFPVFVRLFERDVARYDFVGLLVSVCGLVLATLSDLAQSNSFGGSLLAGVSAISWALHIILARGFRSELEMFQSTLIGQSFGGVFVLPLIFLLGEKMPSFSGPVYFALLGLGLCTAVSLELWCIGIRRVPGHVAGTITMVEAPLGVALTAMMLGDALCPMSIFGGLLVLGSAVTNLLRHRAESNVSSSAT